MQFRSPPGSTPHRIARSALAVSAGLACAVALTVAPASAADDGGGRADRIGKLKGTVGPGFTISINKSSVPAGKYKLIVEDKGTVHNFHILGAGVDKATSVPGRGKTTWKIKLKAGSSYNIFCDPHSETMTDLLQVT